MPFDPNSHHRRSIRLRDWDYVTNGAYFVTLVTDDRAALFGDIVDGAMRMNALGEIAQACWEEIPAHFGHTEIDAFVVMPNHVHGIVMIVKDETTADGVGAVGAQVKAQVGAQHCCAPTTHAINVKVKPGSLGAIVRSYKSAITRQINQLRGTPAEPVWQRNYYERIIRNERELNAIHEYIINNPACWAEDHENPKRM